MKIKSDKGSTEIYFTDLVAVNAAVEQVRAGYRKACADKPDKKDEHKEKVLMWCGRHFGQTPYFRDFDAAVGDATGSEAIRLWEQWLSAQPMNMRKRYYDPSVIAACIMGEDE